MVFESLFSVGYYVEVIKDYDSSDLITYSYPGALENKWVEGVMLEIYPKNREPWIGCFSGGSISPNAINFCCTHPDRISICVVAKGEGYLVNVDDPKKFGEIPLNPIMGVVIAKEQEILVFHDFTKFVAVSKDGIIWKTPSLSWDGIKNIEVKNGTVCADVWDAPNDKNISVEIDVETGSYQGGSSPRKS